MGYELKVWCDECGGEITGKAFCGDCQGTLIAKVEELERGNDLLERDVADLRRQLDELEKEARA